MSKDEYLITDTPLKALTVFAMPMILGSFFSKYTIWPTLLLSASLLVLPHLQLSVHVQHCPMCSFVWHWEPVSEPVCL